MNNQLIDIFDGPLIASRRNPLVKRLKSLASKQGRIELATLLLEGTHLLEEALRTGISPHELVATSSWIKANSKILHSLSKQVLLHHVTPSVLEAALTTNSPDGVAALFPLAGLPKPKKESSFVLALDRLQDPGNLGTLFRTSLAADVEVLWLALGADPLNQKVLRASAGAVLRLPYERLGSSENSAVKELVEKLKLAALGGFQIVSTIASSNQTHYPVLPYWELDWTKPTVLVLGNEGSGIHPLINACCSHFITLPHNSVVESLNVASAAVPLLLERRRVKMISKANKQK